MENLEYYADLKNSNRDEERAVKDIKGEFLEFDRIFYDRDNRNNANSLLLFSEKNQLFKRLDLQTKQIYDLEFSDEKEFKQVELYDGKLFCVCKDPMCITIFFDSRNKKFFHKKRIYFTNKEKRLKENFRFLIWKHHEQGAVYRCLLGPLEDNRYMNFDISERFFDTKSEQEQVIPRTFFVSLALNADDNQNDSVEALCMDEVKRAIICCDKTTNFYEYNGFIQEPSQLLRVIYIRRFMHSKLRKMYCYCPYDFFPQKEKNKLKKVARDTKKEIDLEIFLKKRYREVLLCIEGDYLLKIVSFYEHPFNDFSSWRVDSVGNYKIFNPHDLAINDQTGEIYCLCSDGIKILKDSGRNIGEFTKKFDVVENFKYCNYYS